MNEDFQRAFLTKPIAHRGLHDGNISIPENTLLAFEKAIEKNIPIELDVHIIKDETLIVFHDNNLIRSCHQKIRTETLVHKDLKGITTFNTSHNIPTLKKVLELVNGKIPILIDIKNYTINKNLERNILLTLDEYKGEVALQSFNPFTVYWLKRHSKYPIGYLVSRYNYLHFFDHFLMNKKNLIDFIAIDKKLLDTKHFKHLSKKDIPILLWTITDKREKRAYESYCDNYIFEGFILE